MTAHRWAFLAWSSSHLPQATVELLVLLIYINSAISFRSRCSSTGMVPIGSLRSTYMPLNSMTVECVDSTSCLMDVLQRMDGQNLFTSTRLFILCVRIYIQALRSILDIFFNANSPSNTLPQAHTHIHILHFSNLQGKHKLPQTFDNSD